jgi:hypothetical protein
LVVSALRLNKHDEFEGHQEGYGVKEIKAQFQGDLTLSGGVDLAGDITVGENGWIVPSPGLSIIIR